MGLPGYALNKSPPAVMGLLADNPFANAQVSERPVTGVEFFKHLERTAKELMSTLEGQRHANFWQVYKPIKQALVVAQLALKDGPQGLELEQIADQSTDLIPIKNNYDIGTY